jgi:hypothetical protein
MLSVAASKAGDFHARPMSSRGAFPSPALDQLRRSLTPNLSQLHASAALGNSQSKSLKVFAVPSAGVRAGEVPQRPMQRPPKAGALKVRRPAAQYQVRMQQQLVSELQTGSARSSWEQFVAEILRQGRPARVRRPRAR